MKKQRKTRDPEHIGFKECFGTTTLSFTNALTGVLMSSMLMVYMTEYSGISYDPTDGSSCDRRGGRPDPGLYHRQLKAHKDRQV